MTAVQMPAHRSCKNMASLQCVCGYGLEDCPAVRKRGHKGGTCRVSLLCEPVGGAADVSAE